jgi:hypothetical protein
VVDAVSEQVDQRIVQTLDDGFIQLRVFTVGFKHDALAQFLGQVADKPLEAAEGGADGQHADAQGVVAQFVGQAFDLLGDGLQPGVVLLAGKLGQARLGRDQFADQIDQKIKFLGRDADARSLRFGAGGLAQALDLLLFDQSRLDLAGADQPRLGQKLTDGLSFQQNAFKGVLGDVVFLDQDLTDELVGFLVDALAASDHLDGQVAVFLHEDEHVADIVLASGRGQDDVPPHHAVLGVEPGQGGISLVCMMT